MKRVVEISALAGAVIPIILTIMYLAEVTFRPGETPLVVYFVFYVWPSSFMLLGPSFSVIAWVMAVAVNIILYAFIGVVIKSVWPFLSKRGSSIR